MSTLSVPNAVMTAIEVANKNLAHGTYRHIKGTLSAMFTFEKQKGIYDGVNPMTGVSIPKGKRHGRECPAYTLTEVEKHIALFSGKSPTVISTDEGITNPK